MSEEGKINSPTDLKVERYARRMFFFLLASVVIVVVVAGRSGSAIWLSVDRPKRVGSYALVENRRVAKKLAGVFTIDAQKTFPMEDKNKQSTRTISI